MTERISFDEKRAALRARLEARKAYLRENAATYDADLEVFAADCLKIRPKAGAEMLLRFNRVQRRLHVALERLKKEKGLVRAIILKSRQPGCSTYVAARFYHQVSRQRGLRAFILTHDQDATDNIFDMVQRFHRNNPHAPHTLRASAKELYFDELDSGFEVGTAGTKGVGRSYTIQKLHWSETAWSPNAEEHSAGLLQAVPGTPGTEVILESTANGLGNFFYNQTMAALKRQNEYSLIFIPWYDHEEYETTPPKGWKPPPDIMKYAALHDLSRQKLYWAWRKNGELAAADGENPEIICWRFKQEYPATVEEAFTASRVGSFIASEDVMRARKTKVGDQSHAPRILGCDFATGGQGEGGDSNCFIDRQGRAAGRECYDRFMDKNTVSVAGRLAGHLDRVKPHMAFLDTGGGGAQVYDILCDRGYGPGGKNMLTLVDFGAKANDDRKYANKRAEIWGDSRDWLKDPGGAEIPDDDMLQAEATAPKAREDLYGRIILQRKDEVRKHFSFSPDGWDAVALTFAERVHLHSLTDSVDPMKGVKRGAGWQAS